MDAVGGTSPLAQFAPSFPIIPVSSSTLAPFSSFDPSKSRFSTWSELPEIAEFPSHIVVQSHIVVIKSTIVVSGSSVFIVKSPTIVVKSVTIVLAGPSHRNITRRLYPYVVNIAYREAVKL